ncbi:MAG: DUF2851 family protein [Bacteroidales bacterium]
MENILSYVWRYSLLRHTPIRLCDGTVMEVVSPGAVRGEVDTVFYGSKIRINGKVLAGSVAVYPSLPEEGKNFILYITEEEVAAEGDIPILRLRIGMKVREELRRLGSKLEELPCEESFTELPEVFIADLYTSLALERLQSKSLRILDWVNLYHGDWEEVCYVSLARSLGFGVNSNPFELLARNLPLKFLQKHADSLFQIEALLFGMAGFLVQGTQNGDNYYNRMVNEFSFLKNKFSLSPIDQSLWRFSGVRPTNFPHQRIAFLARLVYGGFSVFAEIIEAKDEAVLRNIFDLYLDDYWDIHYTFGIETPPSHKTLGRSAVDLLIINSVAPLLYSYSFVQQRELYGDRAVALLEKCRSEQNSIVRRFTSHGIVCDNALSSQALIELYNSYCVQRRCLVCRVGHRHIAVAMAGNVKSF